jgi:hypothetical protein
VKGNREQHTHVPIVGLLLERAAARARSIRQTTRKQQDQDVVARKLR